MPHARASLAVLPWRRDHDGQSRPGRQAIKVSRELKLRIVSALVLAAVVLEITWFGGRAFAMLWAVASMLILWEFSRIARDSLPELPKYVSFVLLGAVILLWLAGYQSVSTRVFLLGLAGLAAWELLTRRTIWAASGLAYAGLPFFAIVELRGGAQESLLAVVVLFASVWGADIFAYVAGKTIGGPKLAPRISPKKTWSGFIGSLLGALGLSFAVIIFARYTAGAGFVLLVLALAVVSQIGDLVESRFKRRFDVKDSSNIIPGHGGVLDRIDGLIFAGILMWLVLWITGSGFERNFSASEVFVKSFLSSGL